MLEEDKYYDAFVKMYTKSLINGVSYYKFNKIRPIADKIEKHRKEIEKKKLEFDWKETIEEWEQSNWIYMEEFKFSMIRQFKEWNCGLVYRPPIILNDAWVVSLKIS